MLELQRMLDRPVLPFPGVSAGAGRNTVHTAGRRGEKEFRMMTFHKGKKRGFVFERLALYSLFLIQPSRVFAQAVERFPRPDFQSGYVRPLLRLPEPRSAVLEYIDVFVLIAALSLASYFALKLRSRAKMFMLMIFCLAYFGFFRKGCICPVGSVQNICLGFFGSGYAVPLTAILFFALPLVFTLFFGRTFCAAVCPLGAIQDAVVLMPSPVRPWVAHTLGMIPYVYLGFAILFASAGAGFIICQYDPFVGFFRFGASSAMIFLGISILVLGTVIARPYCRFLCPYGVLLNWMSRLSKWHVRIAPAECNNCRLCEESCPFGAIRTPAGEVPEDRKKSVRRLSLIFLLLPFLTFGGGWVISRAYVPLSRQHVTISLAEELQRGNPDGASEASDAINAFRGSGKTAVELFAEARIIRNRFRTGGWILGAFLGFIGGVKLIGLSAFKRRSEYSADTGTCFSCARCFSYCPFERERLEKLKSAAAEKALSFPQSGKGYEGKASDGRDNG